MHTIHVTLSGLRPAADPTRNWRPAGRQILYVRDLMTVVGQAVRCADRWQVAAAQIVIWDECRELADLAVHGPGHGAELVPLGDVEVAARDVVLAVECQADQWDDTTVATDAAEGGEAAKEPAGGSEPDSPSDFAARIKRCFDRTDGNCVSAETSALAQHYIAMLRDAKTPAEIETIDTAATRKLPAARAHGIRLLARDRREWLAACARAKARQGDEH